MFKFAVVIFAVIACAAAKPGVLAPLAYSSPVVAAPGVVTATSNQVIARNYNGIATAPVVAVAPVAARLAAPLAYSAPSAAAPLALAASPLVYSAHLAATPLGYASPLSYASASLLW